MNRSSAALPSRGALLLPALLLGALLLRLYGIDFGLPVLSNYHFRPDEILIVVPAVRFFELKGNPEFFSYPMLTATVCAIIFQGYFWISKLFGLVEETGLIPHFSRDPSNYFLLARLLSAAAGTVAVGLVYAVGKRIASKWTALLAALLYAVAPLAVRDAHFGVTDTVLACLSTAACYFLIAFLQDRERQRKSLILAALFIGLALATKYTALILLPVALLAIFFKLRRQGLKHSAVVLAMILVVFLVVNPYVVIEFGQFKADLHGEFLHQTFENPRPLPPGPVRMFHPLRYGPGEIAGLIFGLIGVLWGSSPLRERILLLSAILLYMLPMCFSSTPFYRYAVPALPFIAMLTALGIRKLYQERLGAFRYIPIAAAVLLSLIPPLARSVRIDGLLAREDTRQLAGRWILENVSPKVPIVYFGRAAQEPQLLESHASIRRRTAGMRADYPERAWRLLTEIHRLRLRSEEDPELIYYEVHRNPKNLKDVGPRVCVVYPSYPLDIRGLGETPKVPHIKNVARHERFDSLGEEIEGYVIDSTDVFFLPFSRLDNVKRTGPDLDVMLVERFPKK